MKDRIVITGANGAGKTSLAQRLTREFGHPLISKDALALTSRWQQRPRSEVLAALGAATAAERWIIEGGPSVLQPDVLERAQLVIWIDPPAGLRFRRVVLRSLRYFGRTRPEHPPGNRDWPGWRQMRFACRVLHDAKAFEAAIESALGPSTCPVVRLRKPVQCGDDLSRLLKG